MGRVSEIAMFIMCFTTTGVIIVDTDTSSDSGVPSAPPSDVRLHSVGLSSITVKWSSIPQGSTNGYIVGYSVRYQKWQSMEPWYLTVGWYSLKATLNNLEEGTKYIIQVAGNTERGTGVYSSPLEVETVKKQIDPCDSDPCLNGGTCSVQSAVYRAAFYCICSVNFTGIFCASSVHDLPCSNPNVSLPNLSPQDSSATMSIYRSKQFLLQADIILDCELSHKTVFTWSIYQVNPEDILVVSTNGTYELRITPRMLAVGTYYVQLIVSMVGTQVFGIGQGYFKVISSPLVALITGGTKVARGFDRSLVFNASVSYDPDEENQHSSNFSFTWLCTNGQSMMGTITSDSVGCSFTSNESVVTINSSHLLENSSYFITVKISKDQRQAEYTQEVFISPGDPPEVQIRCVENCDVKLNPSSRIALQGICDGPSCKGSPAYQWSIFKNINTSFSNVSEWVEISEIEQLVTTRLSSLTLVTFQGVLAADMQYKFVLTAKRPGGYPGYSEYQVITNSPPAGGDCQVSPGSGVSLTTEFTFTCANWHDTDLPLQYEFVYFTNNDLLNVVHKGQQSSRFTKLRVGEKEKNFTIDFRVRVGDVFGSFTEVDTPVQVVEPKVQTGSMVDLAANLTTGNNSELTQLIQSGDLSGAVQLATAAITAIDDDDAPQTVSLDELREKRIRVKSSILQQVSAVRAETVVRVQQLSNLIAEATSIITEVTVAAQETATGALRAMTSVLKAESSAGETYEVLFDGARSLVAGLGSMLEVSSFGARIHDANSQDVAHAQGFVRRRRRLVNGTSLMSDFLARRQRRNTGHGKPDEKKKERSKERSINILQSLDDVGSTILSRTLVGEKPKELLARSVSLLVSREEPDVLAGSVLSCKGNSLTFPSSAELFNNATKFVDSQVMTTDFLPFSWDHSGERVTTGVSIVELRNSTGHVLNITDLKSPISIKIKNLKDLANNSKSHFIAASRTVFHKIDVTLSGTALILKVRPESNSTDFSVFSKYQARPTPSNNDFNTTIPDFSSCIMGSFGYVNCSNDPYVVYIDNAYVNRTGYYFIGIKIKSRTSSKSRKRRCLGRGRWKRSCVQFKEPPTTAPTYNVPEYLEGDENYTMAVLPVACLYWNTELSKWTNGGCTVDDTTTPDSIHCSCNHLSAFGGQLFVAPNPIDFDLVFTEFIRLSETGNVAVIVAVSCVFGLYLVLLPWARKFDKLDLLKLGTRSFLGLRSPWAHTFEIEVSTGIWRNSGTTAKVFIILEGEQGTSRPYQLKSDSYIPFGRGSNVTFTLSIPIDIGPLRKVRLWHDNSGRSPSWFLNHIKICDLSAREQLTFVCYTWLAVDKGEGLVDRTLTAASSTEKGIDFTVYVQNRIAEEFSDEHLWFSVATRSPRHRFTRVERLSCCLSLLLTIMLASAMFYELDAGDAGSQGTIHLGRFIFNLRDLIIGAQSLFVVMPLNILTVEIFTHTRSANKNRQSQEVSRETASQKREFSLPHWCIYIAWLLCFLTAFVSATLIIFYSVQWDKETSEEWLMSIVTSVLMDIFVSEPLRIIVFAFMLSHGLRVCGRRSSKVRYQTDSVVEVETVQLNGLDKQEEDVKVPKPPSKSQLRRARTNRMRELQMFAALRKIVSYIIYLWILTIVCYGGLNKHGFLMTSSVQNVFGGLSMISSHADVWGWARNVLVPGLYSDGKHSSNTSPYIGDGDAVLVGMPRLRQLRVKKESCKVVSEAQRLFNGCVASYSLDNEETTQSYQPRWKPISLTGKTSVDDLNHICPSAWHYFSADQTQSLPFWGHAHFLCIYSQGGYLAELGYDKSTALNIISELNVYNWIDRFTSVVFVEITVFNAGVSLFSTFTIPIEFSPSGYIFTGHVPRTMYVYDLGGGYSAITVVCQVLLVFYIIYFIVTETNQIIRDPRLYFTQFFTLVELAQTITVIAFVVTHVLKETELFFNTAKLHRNIFQFISFDKSVFLDTLESGLISLLMFFHTVKLLYLLKFNSHVTHLFYFMERSARELLHCSLGFFVFLFAFGHFGYLQFGQIFDGYSSPISAIQTLLLEGVIGGTRYFQNCCPIGRAYILVFKLSLHIIAINICVAVIIEKYRIVRHLSKGKFNLGQFMIRKMKEILGCVREQPGEPQKETVRKSQEVEVSEITGSTLKLIDSMEMRTRQIIRSLNENYVDDFGENSDFLRLWLDIRLQRAKEASAERAWQTVDYCTLA